MKTPEQQIEAIRRNLKLDLDAIKMRADLALSVVAQLEAPPQPVRKAREFWIAYPYVEDDGTEHDFIYEHDPRKMMYMNESKGTKIIHVREVLKGDENEQD